MIVRSITVENWRCYLKPVTVGPFDERLNVIHAPNATGKSTLFEALRRAFMDNHRVTGKAAEAILPWGRDLVPKVTVVFMHDGMEYQITKQFLRNPFSRLERNEKGRFVPFMEGAAADEWMRKMILSDPPGSGLARPENWGLAQILWAPQGNLAFKNLSGSLVDCIHSSLGLQLATTESSAVERKIETLYGEIYTSKGKFRMGKDAALVRVQENLKEVESRLQEARLRLQRFEAVSRRVEDLRARQVQAEREAEEIGKALEAARSQAEKYEKLLVEKQQAQKEAETAQERYNNLRKQIEQIREARKEIAEAQERLRNLNEEVPVAEKEIDSCRRVLARAKSALEDIRKNRRAAEEARTLAEEARAFVENQKQLSAWRKALADIQAARQALEELERQRAALRAPEARTLKRIREALRARDEARRNMEPLLITLEIVPERETAVEVIEGEPPGSRIVPDGTPLRIQGSPQVAARLPGIARLRARGPAESIEEHRRAFTEADRALRKLTEPFGTDDIEELERRHEEAGEIARQISNRKTEIDTLSEGAAVPELFVRERAGGIARLEATQREILNRHPEWQITPPDAGALGRMAQDAYQAYSEKEEAAEAACEKAQGALTAAEKRREKLLEKSESQKELLSRSQSLLDRLTSDGKTDEEREERLSRLSLEWGAAKDRMERVDRELSTFAPDTLRSVEKLEKQLEALRETARSARDEANIEEGQLRTLAAEGPYSEMVRLEEEFAELERQVREEKLRAEAIRLLYETMENCRREALSAVTGPVERAASRMLHRIAGDRLGAVKLKEDFVPQSICPEQGVEASLENVSGGEWEQIHLVTRLALAEVLAREERQLVVWDDALSATDMGRLGRVLTLIEEAADRLQIMILTCHPERYRGLAGAQFIDLAALVGAA